MNINPNIAIIEGLPGVGGDESKLWMKELLLSYIKYAEKNGYKWGYIEDDIIKISGENVFNKFKNETGVHRVQRIPATERKGRECTHQPASSSFFRRFSTKTFVLIRARLNGNFTVQADMEDKM